MQAQIQALLTGGARGGNREGEGESREVGEGRNQSSKTSDL